MLASAVVQGLLHAFSDTSSNIHPAVTIGTDVKKMKSLENIVFKNIKACGKIVGHN